MPRFLIQAKGSSYEVTASSEQVAAQAVAQMLGLRSGEGGGQQETPQPSKLEQDRARQMEALPPDASAVERPPGELVPQEFRGGEGQVAQPLQAAPTPQLIAETRKAITGKEPTETEVKALEKAARSTSTRNYFNELIARGLSPETTFDAEQTPLLAKSFEEYKRTMEPSMLGAASRGAIENIGPTLGGIAGGTLGSVGGIVGAIGGGVAGGALGGLVQEAAFPPTPEDIAQRQFDVSQTGTKAARYVGGFAPGLVAGVPSLSRLQGIAGVGTQEAIKQARQLAIREGAIGAGASFAGAAMQGRLPNASEIAEGALMGAITRPTAIATLGMNKPMRTERAARGAAETVMREFAGSPEAVALSIERQAPRYTGEFRPMTGELSGDVGLVRLQSALETSGNDLTRIRLENERVIAKNLNTELQGTGIPFEETQRFFQDQNTRLIQAAQDARDASVQAANAEHIAATEKATRDLQQLSDLSKKGIISEEQRYAASLDALNSARETMLTKAAPVRAGFSSEVESIINKNAAQEKAAYSRAYAEAEKSGAGKSVGISETVAAIRKVVEDEVGSRGDVPDYVKKLKADLIKKKNAPDSQPIKEIISDIRNISGKINETDNKTTRRHLTMVMEGLKADLKKAGETNEKLKKANRLFFEYADKYIDGASGSIVTENQNIKQPASETINKYVDGGLEDMQRLRRAVKDDPAAINAIKNWFLNVFSEKASVSNPEQFLKQERNSQFLSVFPEALPDINARVSGMRTAEAGVETARAGVAAQKEAAAETIKAGKEQRTADIAAAREQKQLREAQAQEALKTEQERVANLASTRTLGQSPENAILGVFQSGDPRAAIKEIVQRTSGNKNATEGVKNALKEFLNAKLRVKGRVPGGGEETGTPIPYSDLASSFAKMNTYLAEGSPERAVLEAVFTPKEMGALDTIRKQIEISERKRLQSGGESPTARLTAAEKQVEEKMENAVSLLRKLALGEDRQGLKKMLGVVDMIRSLWKGDVKAKATRMLIDSQADPQLGIALLRKAGTDNKELTKYIKLYAVTERLNPEERPQPLKK